MIEVSGTLTRAEVMRMQYFHTLRRLWPVVVLAVLLLLVTLPPFLFVLITASQSEWRSVLSNLGPFIFFLLMWVFLLTVSPYWNARKQFAAQSPLSEPVTYLFTPENLSAKGPSVSWTMTWGTLKHVRETKSLFVLYHHKKIAILVPKRFFHDDAEIRAWRQLVLSSVATKRIEAPGLIGRWC